ncbi:sulfate transporter/antisigma-factor antagonist STAS [Nostoc sp. NIES-4103]|nr:sulfate transporter/antisigma-factor antagonist STAS [Nostoc sp. NIES-4103]
MSLTNTINLRNLQGDLFGGVTAAIVSLALALAFGRSGNKVSKI